MSDLSEAGDVQPATAVEDAPPPRMVRRKVVKSFEAHPWPHHKRTEFNEGSVVELPEDIAASADAAGLTRSAD